MQVTEVTTTRQGYDGEDFFLRFIKILELQPAPLTEDMHAILGMLTICRAAPAPPRFSWDTPPVFYQYVFISRAAIHRHGLSGNAMPACVQQHNSSETYACHHSSCNFSGAFTDEAIQIMSKVYIYI